MNKLNSAGNKIQEEPSSSQDSKFGISHCDRFEINKSSEAFLAKKMTSNYNRSESTSNISKNNLGVKGRFNYNSINSSEASNNEKELARTNINSRQSNHSKELNFWNALIMNKESTAIFQNEFEHSQRNVTKNHKNEFPVPNQIDIKNKIYEKREAAERFNSNKNSDNSSPNNNSNNPISENDVDMDFIFNLTNLNNNENNVIYNFNKNFNQERKKGEFENDAFQVNPNRNVQNSSSSRIQSNTVKNQNKNFKSETNMQVDSSEGRRQQVQPIHKKPKTPLISQSKHTEDWKKMDDQVENSRNIGNNVINSSSSSGSNNSSNNPNNNIHNNSKINSNQNYMKMFNNPEIQLDDNKISSLKFNLQNRNKGNNRDNAERSQIQSNANNSQENNKETSLINFLAQYNNLLQGGSDMGNIYNNNLGNLSSNNSNSKASNQNSLNSLVNILGNLNNNAANSNNMNIGSSKLLNMINTNSGLNDNNNFGNWNMSNNFLKNPSSQVGSSVNNKQDDEFHKQGNANQKSNNFANNTQNNSQSSSIPNSNSQRSPQEKEACIRGFLVDKVSEILSGNTLNEKMSLLKMITNSNNNNNKNSAQSFAENYVLSNYVDNLNRKAFESQFQQEVIKYTIESFCKYLKSNNYLIVKNQESSRDSSNPSDSAEEKNNSFNQDNKINSNSNSNTNIIAYNANSDKSSKDNKQENSFMDSQSGSRSKFDSVTHLNKKRNKSPKEGNAMTNGELEWINNNNQEVMMMPVKEAKSKLGNNLHYLNENKAPSKHAAKSELVCCHNDKKHYAKNMCKSCYHSKGRVKKAWLCPHIYQTHYARGKCRNCYLNFYNKEHNKKKIKANECLEIIESRKNVSGNNLYRNDGNYSDKEYSNNQVYDAISMNNVQTEKMLDDNYDIKISQL